MPLDDEIRIQSYRKILVGDFWNVLDVHSYGHCDWLNRRKLELQRDIYTSVRNLTFKQLDLIFMDIRKISMI